MTPDELLEAARASGVRAIHTVYTNKPTMSVHFQQIPNQPVVAMMLTLLKDKKRTKALDPVSFKKVMGMIEDAISPWSNEETGMLVPLRSMTTQMTAMNCHRVLLVPESRVFDVIEAIFTLNHVQYLKYYGIEQSTVFINTNTHSGSMDFN